MDKVLGQYEYLDCYGSLKTKPKYAIENKRSVEFSVERDGKIDGYSLSVCLDNVNSDELAVNELKIIASDLQKVYSLSYTPNIYVFGKAFQAKSS